MVLTVEPLRLLLTITLMSQFRSKCIRSIRKPHLDSLKVISAFILILKKYCANCITHKRQCWILSKYSLEPANKHFETILVCCCGFHERNMSRMVAVSSSHLPWQPVNLDVSVQRQFHFPRALFTCLMKNWGVPEIFAIVPILQFGYCFFYPNYYSFVWIMKIQIVFKPKMSFLMPL